MLEIGSLHGLDAIEVMKTYSLDRVITIECNPECIEICRKNFAPYPNITLVEVAAWHTDGSIPFYRVTESKDWKGAPTRNIGASSCFQTNDSWPFEKYTQEKIEVPARRLEGVLKGLQVDAVDLICMDAQGAELYALQGMGPYLDRVQAIITELELKPMYHGQTLFDDVQRFLGQHGFKLAAENRWAATAGDFLFVRESARHREPVSEPRAEARQPSALPPARARGGCVDHYLAGRRDLIARFRSEGAVIGQPWGGLGDNLAFSTVPEGLAELGIKCYISRKNHYRNPEIEALVWKRNPHIAGVVDREPNAGAALADDYDKRLPISLSFIERVELAHGIRPRNKAPKLYYQPRPRPEFKDRFLVDIGSITMDITTETLSEYLKYVLVRYQYDLKDLVQVRFKTAVASKNGFAINELAGVPVNSIFDYCDLLASARGIITVLSGAQSLAVAMREHNPEMVIHAYVQPLQFNWRNYIYEGVEYFVK